METLVDICEITEGPDEENVFRNVVILGNTSKNGRTYSPEAMTKALPLYEGLPCYIDHDRSGKGIRSYRDRIGFVQNARLVEGKVRADFVMNPHMALAESVLWDAKHGSKRIGFSHSAMGRMSPGTKIVEHIEPTSVDIVSDPATTKSFFEQTEADNAQHIKELAALTEQVTSLQRQIEEITKTNKARPVAIAPTQPVAERFTYDEWLDQLRNKN